MNEHVRESMLGSFANVKLGGPVDGPEPTIRSFRGRKIQILRPRLEDVDLEEMAHALSHINRFGGHARFPYSVAQHSVHVMQYVERYDAPWARLALLHDAPEAYLGDIVRPLKKSHALAPAYDKAERRWEEAIQEVTSVAWPAPMPQIVKEGDIAVWKDEARWLFPDVTDFDFPTADAFSGVVEPVCWTPEQSRYEFLKHCRRLDIRLRR